MGLLAPILWVVVSLTPGPALAYCQLTSGSKSGGDCATEGVPLFWPRRCTTVALDGSSHDPELYQRLAQEAFDKWTDVRCGGIPTGIDVTVPE